jgi:signal transduction histidine kinase
MESVLNSSDGYKNHHDQENTSEWVYFMDRLVHDLREPLRSINVFAELLIEAEKDRLNEQSKQFVDEIQSGAARMQTLLSGLSGYSMALHEASAAPANCSLQSALKIVLANMDEKIRLAGASVTPGDLPRVSLSLDRAMQILQHLIENSLRFRSDAPPVIHISAEEEDGGMCAIHVEDNGIGVPDDYLEVVFKPFTRVEGKKYPGAGMGLAICRRIVEAHGGAIRMTRAATGGSICTFTLPEA